MSIKQEFLVEKTVFSFPQFYNSKNKINVVPKQYDFSFVILATLFHAIIPLETFKPQK